MVIKLVPLKALQRDNEARNVRCADRSDGENALLRCQKPAN